MRWRLNRLRSGCVALLLLTATVTVELLLAQSPIDLTGSRRRATGAPVAPVFEGWEPNGDGTFSLYFGYQNRNWEEEVDIPVGPNNFFSPAPQDRGQPTHFLVNRQKKAFTVIVPKDFGNQTIVWTLVSRGSTETVPGKLSALLQIAANKNDDNAAPKVNLGPNQTIRLPEAATLTATVSSGKDETGSATIGGRAARAGRSGRGNRAQRLTIKWRKYRGTGTVTFSDPAPEVKDGRAITNATFSEPGIYVLQTVADEGSMNDSSGIPGFLCCWTNTQVTITVMPASARP